MNLIEASDRVALAGLFRGGWTAAPDVTRAVAAIALDVRNRGDAALIEFTRTWDDPLYDVSRLRVPIPMHEGAKHLVAPEIGDALRQAKERIARFHERQRHGDLQYVEGDGTRYGLRYRPLEAVAAYIAGGNFPSLVLANVIPAKVAGVSRTIVLTPPGRDGRISPAVLYACALCEVDELYAVGGAQAIAAAAYGTESVAPVKKIIGTGNAYVTEAMRQVFGVCDVGPLRGPGEMLVVADDGANSEYVVGELLACAEQDPRARVAVASDSRSLLDAVAQLLDTLEVGTLPHGEIISEVMARGSYGVHAKSLDEIRSVMAAFAPDHVSLMVRDPEPYLNAMRQAGVVSIGDMTPIAGTTRFYVGLVLADFMQTFGIVENSRERMLHDAQSLAALAESEGLPANAQAARMRSGA